MVFKLDRIGNRSSAKRSAHAHGFVDTTQTLIAKPFRALHRLNAGPSATYIFLIANQAGVRPAAHVEPKSRKPAPAESFTAHLSKFDEAPWRDCATLVGFFLQERLVQA